MTNQHSADGSTEVAVAELELEEILQHCHFIPIQDSPDSTSAVAIALDDDDDIKATKNDRDIYVVPNLAQTVHKKIVVVSHDYDGNGSSFSHILFEYDDAAQRALKATKMYPDRKVQLEMDFFMGVCRGNGGRWVTLGFLISIIGIGYWV
jgi:hypothetical protein